MSEEDKITRGLLETLSRANAEDYAVPILVRYRSERRVLRGGANLHGLERVRQYHLRPYEHMYATPSAIRHLAEEPDVVRIFQDLPVHAYLDHSVGQIQVPRLWEEGLSGAGIKIAIVDTGIDPGHQDFTGRIEATTDLTGEGPKDLNGHGTHCAGIAAGSGAASGGKYRGVAPAATLCIAKVLDAGGNGMMSDVMAGIEWAVDQGARVISLSLGGAGPCDGTDALSEICNAAVEAGAVVCVAAGNDGPSPYTVGTPGCASEVITIGAVDDLDEVAEFSSRGPTLDGRGKPDIMLPGVDIVAPRAAGTAMGETVDEYYTSASGTSMATPHAAGVCALLMEAEPDLKPTEIKARLMETALDLGADPNAQGRGRLDAWRALQEETSPQEPLPPSPTPEPPPAPRLGCVAAILGALPWLRRR